MCDTFYRIAPAANPTFISILFSVCVYILCGMRILTTLLVYQQVKRMKNIIYAIKIYALYVNIYHGSSPTPFVEYYIV